MIDWPGARWSRFALGRGVEEPRPCAVDSEQAVPYEIAEVGIHRVDMDLEQPGDCGSGEIGGPKQKHLRTTALPRLQRLLKPLMDPPEFGRVRFSGSQRT